MSDTNIECWGTASDPVTAAKNLLLGAKEGAYPFTVEAVWSELEKSGLSPEDIGTTEKELWKMYQQQHFRHAAYLWGEIKAGSSKASPESLALELHAAGASCRDLGETKEDFQATIRKWHSLMAKREIESLKSEVTSGNPKKLMRHLALGGLSLGELGVCNKSFAIMLRRWNILHQR